MMRVPMVILAIPRENSDNADSVQNVFATKTLTLMQWQTATGLNRFLSSFSFSTLSCNFNCFVL